MTDRATISDRSDMVFYSQPVRGEHRYLFALIRKLGGPDVYDNDDSSAWIEKHQRAGENDFGTIWRVIAEKHDCTIVHDKYYGIQFSGFASDEDAVLFKLKYL